jgi:hypothetical protein
MASWRTSSNISVGQSQLIDSETARCTVRWSHSSLRGMSCSFSVRIKTHVGESWLAREERAIAEARRFAQGFLDAAEAVGEADIAPAA